MFELFINTKKELKIEESTLLKSSKILNSFNGAPKSFDIRTFKKYLSMIDLETLNLFYKYIKEVN
jgi:hypothetical protein